VQHSGQHEVVDVVALAADEAGVLLALDAAVADWPVRVAGSGVGLPLMDDGEAFTSESSVSVATSATTVSVPSRTSSAPSPPPAAGAGWAAAHCTERTIVA
jgi:hypothetical protein